MQNAGRVRTGCLIMVFDLAPYSYNIFTFSHLSDVLIQSNLQNRQKAEIHIDAKSSGFMTGD